MRAGRPSLALTSLAFWPLACAVYNDDSLGLGLAGSASIDNNSGGSSAGAKANGGSLSTAGTTSGALGGSGNAGGTAGQARAGNGGDEMPAVGGDGSADGGEPAGGAASGGKGGASAGAGGKGGASNGGVPATAGASGASGAGGNVSGNGGGPSVPACKDHPLTARSGWTASASHSDSAGSGLPANLLDGKITRWSTGKPQSGDEWLQIDFGAVVTLNHVNLQQGDDTNDYPRTYSVIVSNTAKDLSGVVWSSGSGKSGVSTAILLPALATGRYLLLKQTATSLSWWSAEEMEVSCTD